MMSFVQVYIWIYPDLDMAVFIHDEVAALEVAACDWWAVGVPMDQSTRCLRSAKTMRESLAHGASFFNNNTAIFVSIFAVPSGGFDYLWRTSSTRPGLVSSFMMRSPSTARGPSAAGAMKSSS